MDIPIEKNIKSLKDLAKEAETARRKMEDLAQSIIDTRLSMQGTGMEQRDLGATYSSLAKERALLVAQIGGTGYETSGDITKRARVAEIDKELEKTALQMNVNNQSLTKDLVSIGRDTADLVVDQPSTYASKEMVYAKLEATAPTPFISVNANAGGTKSVTINLTQHNTGVASDADALNKVLGKIAAQGGVLP
jgi:hypothetical protein